MNGRDLPECNRKVYHKGEHIATIINLKPEVIESIVKTTSEESGQKVDWFYFGGRGVVKALGDIDKARVYLKRGLFGVDERCYRFTTENDSVLRWPIR
jgi:predicted chitinase